MLRSVDAFRSPALRPDLARWAAETIRDAFDEYLAGFHAITRRARGRFESRDWHGGQQDALERLGLRERYVAACLEALRAGLRARSGDPALWTSAKARYEEEIEARPDLELAETFYNSVARRLLGTVGVLPECEFVGGAVPDGGRLATRVYPRQATTEALLQTLLRDLPFEVPWQDLEVDARLAAAEIDAHLRSLEDDAPLSAIEVLRPVFFRNKGAYVVGRIRRETSDVPLVLPILNDERGLWLDAVLLTPTDASVVFSFTRSYFHVDLEAPREIVPFLRALLPQKRTSELYIAIGFHKHGKTLLYREIMDHLARTGERFLPARGDRGMVMIVFTLPSLDVIFKVIRDRFAFPKSTSRAEVMQKYQLVFRHDRAGRLVDAQEFEHLAFERDRFAPELLAELEAEAGGSVETDGTRLVVKHLYAERRVEPLNLFIRAHDEWTARQALLDYGQSIKDLAATNTFPGDLLLKNFGVTRSGRVVFYDYDELTLVTDCRFRDMPRARDDGEETAGEAWFYVGDDDVFPEEFLKFLGLPERLRDAFVGAHGEVLDPRFWRAVQERHRAGEIADIFPYRESQRLRHGKP
jgi:isocitrate dehydrogenase kinase/phosphatase